MKRTLLTALMVLICTIGYSQISYNVKAGLNLSTHMGKEADDANFRAGIRVGAGMEYRFNELLSLQPSLFFTQKGMQYSFTPSGESGFKNKFSVTQIYLEIPVNAQLRFAIADNTNFIFATGPYIACGIAGNAKTITRNDGTKSSIKKGTFANNGADYNRFDLGWNIGAGVELGRILVGLDTQLGFCNMRDIYKARNANISITVGYLF